jgi:hypothetical protein
MVNQYPTNMEVILMLFVKNKLLMERPLFIILNLLILDITILIYLNVKIMLSLGHMMQHLILQDQIIYFTHRVSIVNQLLMLILIQLGNPNLDGLVAVVQFYVPVITIIIFTIILDNS